MLLPLFFVAAKLITVCLVNLAWTVSCPSPSLAAGWPPDSSHGQSVFPFTHATVSLYLCPDGQYLMILQQLKAFSSAGKKDPGGYFLPAATAVFSFTIKDSLIFALPRLLRALCSRSVELPCPEEFLTSLNNSVVPLVLFIGLCLPFLTIWNILLCILAEIGKLLNQVNQCTSNQHLLASLKVRLGSCDLRIA